VGDARVKRKGGRGEEWERQGEGDKCHYWQIRFHLCPSRQQLSSHYPKVHKGWLVVIISESVGWKTATTLIYTVLTEALPTSQSLRFSGPFAALCLCSSDAPWRRV